MSILYSAVQRANPSKRDEVLWYPVLKRISKLSEREVALQISEETTLNPKEAEISIYQLEKILVRSLLNGQTVSLGEIGTFSLTVKATGSATAEEVSARSVNKIMLRFRPSDNLRYKLNQATLSPVKSLDSVSKQSKTKAIAEPEA